MDLKGIIYLLGQSRYGEEKFVDIVIGLNRRLLFHGNVKDVPLELLNAGWEVMEIIRTDSWDGHYLGYLQKYDRPYKIFVTV